MNAPDVIVLGGGPAGAAAALALRRLGASVTIIEALARPRPRLGETLPAKALPLLDRLGVGDQFRQQGHLPVQAIRSAWGAPTLEDRLSMFNPHGPGWHLDRRTFDDLLIGAARECGVDVLTGTRVVDTYRDANRWHVRLRASTSERTMSAGFLIDATGRGGFLTHRLGSQRPPVDRLIGISRRYFGAGEIEPWTLVESIRDGWWYSAPLPDGDLLAVFMTDADLVQGGTAAVEAAWPGWLEATQHTRHRLGTRSARTEWHTQSAVSCRAVHSSGEPWLAVGDAAFACDPLAGQGLSIAFETALAAAHAIGASHSTDALKRYAVAIETQWIDYLRQRTDVYNAEARWPDTPFWNRRRG